MFEWCVARIGKWQILIFCRSDVGLDQDGCGWSKATPDADIHPVLATSIQILDKNARMMMVVVCPSGHGVGNVEMAGRWLKRGHDPNSPLSWPIIQPLIAALQHC